MATVATDSTFERDVLERSDHVPVVVDLWATWCGPCVTLGPILEKVVASHGGTVELVKVDVDQNPRISGTFSVQSIPAVFAISNRQVVDQFVGALPEAEVAAFVGRLVPSITETEAESLVRAGDEASLRRALELEPDHGGAILALAQLLSGRGDDQEVLEMLARIPETPESRQLAAHARLALEGAPTDAASVECRLELLLDSVKADEAARKEYLDLLEVLGANDERSLSYRRKLATRLY